jgi:SAM-dependent methyltransferase
MSDYSNGQVTGLLSPLLERARNRRAARLIRDGESVLDIGCGRATLLTTLYESGKRDVRYFGIDRLADCVKSNQQEHPEHRFREADLARDADLELGQQFDVIAMLAIIEHLSHPEAVLRRLSKQLSPAGRLIITTPHRGAERLHALAARIGFCSREACEEHNEVFPDHAFFQEKQDACGLRLDHYERFLMGLNQLAVMSRKDQPARLLNVAEAS